MSINLQSGELLRDAMVDTRKEHGECDACERFRNLDAGICAFCEGSAVPPTIAAEAMGSHIGTEEEAGRYCTECLVALSAEAIGGKCQECESSARVGDPSGDLMGATEVTSEPVAEPLDGETLHSPVIPSCEMEGCDREGIECPIDGRHFCPIHLNEHMERIMDAQRAAGQETEEDDIPL